MTSPDISHCPQAIQDLISAFQNRQFEALPGLFAPESYYWVQGTPPAVPYGGDLPAAERLPQAQSMLGQFDSFEFNVKELVTSENRESAAIIADVRGDGSPLGSFYENDVLIILTLDSASGLITRINEYLDNNNPLALSSGRAIYSRPPRPRTVSKELVGNKALTRRVIEDYVSAQRQGDWAKLKSLFIQDAFHWVNGRPPALLHGGWMNARERLQDAEAARVATRDYQLQATHMIVEPTKTVLEANVSWADVNTGQEVRGSIALVFFISDDLVAELWEFGDHVSSANMNPAVGSK